MYELSIIYYTYNFPSSKLGLFVNTENQSRYFSWRQCKWLRRAAAWKLFFDFGCVLRLRVRSGRDTETRPTLLPMLNKWSPGSIFITTYSLWCLAAIPAFRPTTRTKINRNGRAYPRYFVISVTKPTSIYIIIKNLNFSLQINCISKYYTKSWVIFVPTRASFSHFLNKILYTLTVTGWYLTRRPMHSYHLW